MAIDDDTAIVGAYGDDDLGFNSGSVYVFNRNTAGLWMQTTKLVADEYFGMELAGFGGAVAISGNTAVIGAASYRDNGVGSQAGAAYVFQDDGTGNWTQIAKLTAPDKSAGALFGVSVAINGDTAVVGAYEYAGASHHSGAAYVFHADGAGTWSQVAKFVAPDADEGDRFGSSVAIKGNVLVAGAPGDDDGGEDAGAAYVFTDIHGGWEQVAKLAASDGQPGDFLGVSAATDGAMVLSGAIYTDNSGSAYVFDVSQLVALPVRGDYNGDGIVDTQDINPFILALTQTATWADTFVPDGTDPLVIGDLNGDGYIDTQDINPFVVLLTGGSPAVVVPEPATVGIVVLGAFAASLRRRW